MLTVPLEGAAAQLLADQAMIVQDLQFVMDCCRRLLAELDRPDTERDGVVPQSLWSAALTAYARCFAYGKKYGLQADDVRALPLEGEVLKFHQWILDEGGKMTGHPTNPFDAARVGAALSPPDGKRGIKGIAILSTSRLLVDDVGVRQLGGLASALANLISGRAQQQQDTVLAEARKISLDTLYQRTPLQAGPTEPPSGADATADEDG
jgi:hypothetical protein